MLKLSLPVKTANLDYGVAYSCSADPEPQSMLHSLLHVTTPGSEALYWLCVIVFKTSTWKLTLKCTARILYCVFIKVCNMLPLSWYRNIVMQCIPPCYMCVLCLWNIVEVEKRSQVVLSSISQHSLWHYKHWQTDLESLDRHPAECWQ